MTGKKLAHFGLREPSPHLGQWAQGAFTGCPAKVDPPNFSKCQIWEKMARVQESTPQICDL